MVEACSWAKFLPSNRNHMKSTGKRKSAKAGRANKNKMEKAVEVFRLERPIQTALYAKLVRLGYEA